jgi:hypothetical protein
VEFKLTLNPQGSVPKVEALERLIVEHQRSLASKQDT